MPVCTRLKRTSLNRLLERAGGCLALALLVALVPESFGSKTPPAVAWARQIGGSGTDLGYGIVADPAGNSYAVGCFQGTATFGDTNVTSLGAQDMFIAKYDTDGDLLWVRHAGGGQYAFGYGVAVDSSGNVWVTGKFVDSISFDGVTLTSRGGDDIFLAKYDLDGNLLWVQQAGGSGYDQAEWLVIDAAGNCYLTGKFDGTAVFGDTTLIGAGSYDMFLAKYDSAGNLLWVRSAGGSGDDEGWGVALDSLGRIVVTGLFSGTAGFGKVTLTAAGGADAFIARYDAAGNCLWARQVGGTGDDVGSAIATDSMGNSYVTGMFEGRATFGGTQLTSSGPHDIFVAKYSRSGHLCWVRQIGGLSSSDSFGIAVDAAGNSYLTGAIQDTVVLDGVALTSNGGSDVLAAKYDTWGNLKWATHAGGGDNETGSYLALDSSYPPNIYLVGLFQGTMSIGTNALPSQGGFDAFVAKLDPDTGAPAGGQPDLEIKRSWQPLYLGHDIFGTNGDGQTVTQTAVAVQTRVFDIKLINNGPQKDSFLFRGDDSVPGFEVKYFSGSHGSNDITGAVAAGLYAVSGLSVRANAMIRLEMTPNAGAQSGSAASVLVTATSTANGSKVDAVSAVVTVR